MRVTVWGCRGSIASAGPDTTRYGGNTACLQLTGKDDTIAVLDAGTGIRRLGATLSREPRAMHLFLSHLHMDHIQGLGFFHPLFWPDWEIHIWGPPSTTADLRTRLTRYLSPPLFPVTINDLRCHLELHDASSRPVRIGMMTVRAETIIHPGPTVGYRIEEDGVSVAYLPDHEPALGGSTAPAWSSGFRLAARADLLLHDAQYTADEYATRLGWGHSTVTEAVSFADRAEARRLVLFHHDPEHDDRQIDALVEEAASRSRGTQVSAAQEGATYAVRRS